MIPTPAAQLAEEASMFLEFERLCDFTGRAARDTTRSMLREKARKLGFADKEIEAAVDRALGGKR